MIPSMFAGLRGRLLLALVLTSVITLAAAAAVVLLGPLQERLRSQSLSNVENQVLAARPQFVRAMREKGNERLLRLQEVALRLRRRTDARILVGNQGLWRRSFTAAGGVEPGFLYDTDNGAAITQAQRIGLRSIRLEHTLADVQRDDVSVAVRMFDRGRLVGVIVAQRRLTEVTAAVVQVRNALLVAGIVGIVVSLIIAVGVSSTLLRRLDRLRSVALRISAEGPDAPAPPRDTRSDEVADLASTLARMQVALRRQEAARRAFVATASHELRTPLTMLQGTMELLEEDLGDGRLDLADAQLQVANARRELRRLTNLASELLDLSRLDAAVSLRSEPVELGEVARAVAAEFEVAARERGASVDVFQPPEPCWGRGDPDAIARIVRILVDNALRHGPEREPVRVTATLVGRTARIEVADRGPGIPPDEREQIFERFHRGRAGGSKGGFGLGLAIGRGLAERMGGTLGLGDTAGPGARFVLTLHAADGARPAPAPAKASAAS